jgi:ATP-dependent helicase/nuclease subunit A
MPAQKNNVNSLDACNPAFNATVSASAGSGKTWLLITRIVRLLIAGAEPGNIIALTFTRKAAGEMQIRLNQRLFAMATADEKELEELLQMIGCSIDNNNKIIAAGLYEKLIHSLYPIRIQTFHSFCQDILSRFPLEADIPPGFELIEDTSLLERQAWQALFAKANPLAMDSASKQQPDSLSAQQKLIEHLDIIMQFCNGPDNTQTALNSFLAHRSDWWAYTAHTAKPVDFACRALAQSLQLDEGFARDEQKPAALFLNDSNTEKLMIFSNLLREIKNITSEKHADSIDTALKDEIDSETRFSLITSAFIKKDGEKLIQGRQYSAALEKKLGAENASRFIELHDEIAEKIQQITEQNKRLLSLKINSAWYFAGHKYLEIFQQLKREMRLLDFTDLEWKCYELLQHADNAHWVQYKIDQRIDHILIDEFQDTNPTQWHLLSPILEEIAAGPEQRTRSVFLVGDEKQSIYSFRRANPALQFRASQWLAQNLQAIATPLDFSRRSSAAIIECVNQIFEQPDIREIMTGYSRHDTWLKKLPGQVMLCELFDEDETASEEAADHETENNINDVSLQAGQFRNPLKQPREISLKTVRHKEADYIARQILQLKNGHRLITENDRVRPIEFGDIMILMRNRTHIDIYEEALKQHGIAFIGSKKGGLLDNLEIQDLMCLLNTLITPYNNLALAQVLKSPIFNASDEDLIVLAIEKNSTHWYERLLQLAADPGDKTGRPALSDAFIRAATLLPRWQQLAEQLPVHDCLDRIFSEGNIIKRYVAANRTENRQKVAANCQRFLELSLETDSGRYPSITRFLQQLNHLKHYSANPPEEPLSQSDESRVRLMTIHGSKGLESPVVFLADCNSASSNRNAYASLVRWPAEESRPVSFQLQLNKDNTDQVTQKLQQEKISEQAREELNLLYVALTRAREQLYISGIRNSRSNDMSWYQIIASGLKNITEADTTVDDIGCRVFRHLAYDPITVKQPQAAETPTDAPWHFDERLLKPLAPQYLKKSAAKIMIAPSLYSDDGFAADKTLRDSEGTTSRQAGLDVETARWRGIIIHRTIEQLCKSGIYPAVNLSIERIYQQLKADIALQQPAYLEQLDSCMQEAVSIYNNADFTAIFNPDADTRTYNEMPLMYKQGAKTVYGIVDRVIRSDDKVKIIDYKSHRFAATETANKVAQQYTTQLQYYADGIRKLWPAHSVRAGILFTRQQEMIWLI